MTPLIHLSVRMVKQSTSKSTCGVILENGGSPEEREYEHSRQPRCCWRDFSFPEAAVVCGDGDYGGLTLSLPGDRAKADGSGGWTDCWTGNESVETRGSAAIGILLQGIGWDANKSTHG